METREQGFTLVELMVVVAIVGLLASIAIPSYDRFQARARSTEAKIALGAIYTAESAYAAENLSYTACLANIGFSMEGPTRYFRVGFTALQATGALCGPNGNQNCNEVNWPLGGGAGTPCQVDPAMNPAEPYVYPATARMVGATTLPTDADMNQYFELERDSFTVGAISNSPMLASNDLLDAQSWTQVAVATLSAFEGSAQASPGSHCHGNGHGNNSLGCSGPSGGSSGSGGSGGSGGGSPCAQQMMIWSINSDRELTLMQFCQQ